MNRKQRRIAQAQAIPKTAIEFRGQSYTAEEAGVLAIREYTLGDIQAALDIFRLILAKTPDNAMAHNNYGVILQQTGQYPDALRSFEAAIALNAHYPDAYNNRGLALHALGRYGDALESYEQAIALKANEATAYNNRGNALLAANRHDEALASYKQALMINPAYADAYNNLGNALLAANRRDEALVHFEKAAALNPKSPYLLGALLIGRLHLCQWQGLEAGLEAVKQGIEEGRPVCSAFAATILLSSPALQRRCAEIYGKDKYPPQALVWNARAVHEKIRVGYFSADFYNHATAYLAAEMFALHDRAKFEVIGISFGYAPSDEMRQRLEKNFDRFIDVSAESDLEIAELTRTLEIDIAIDLKGFTLHSRPGIFARRAAPIQAQYLGFPSTMGASYIDYLIADSVLIPEASRPFYSEKIAYLPDSYQVTDSSRKISERIFTRSECGLPEKGFVFCCFNNNYKINPDIFSLWMRLLQAVPGSVLWLYADHKAAENLRAEAAARGIAADRLVFAGKMEQADHLARHRLADLFLDTFPYNAHTTASDALWAGLPVLTRMGETFASRVAASLLTAVGLTELITHSHEEYEALVLVLARDPEKLSALRQTLANNRLTQPLFNTKLFTRNIEAAYRSMWEKYQAGMPPEHINGRIT